MNIRIIIPAHNEEQRIKRTIQEYCNYFAKKWNVEVLVVLNGCTDNTLSVVKEQCKAFPKLSFIDLAEAGKGLALKAGFQHISHQDNELIGFVDADMATVPAEFEKLVINIGDFDGIIASRYMPGASVYPPRPWIKRWGSKLFYEPLVWLLFGFSYYDFQCGAKVFRRSVINAIAEKIITKHWAIDVELLYLAKKHGFRIREFPTTWHDQEGSKLRVRHGLDMIVSLLKIKKDHM